MHDGISADTQLHRSNQIDTLYHKKERIQKANIETLKSKDNFQHAKFYISHQLFWLKEKLLAWSN